MSRRSYFVQTQKMVENLLPGIDVNKWDFTNQEIVNSNYSPSNYIEESVRPSQNVIVTFPSGNYSECYMAPKPEYYPYLSVGHTYYIRFYARKEKTGNSPTPNNNTNSNNSFVTYDIYWPEMENALFRGMGNGQRATWLRYSSIITLQQSQWPNNTVSDGKYKFRFDCNNQRRYVKYQCYADFMLIDLTKDFVGNGYAMPLLSELDAKPYFDGSINIDDWN